MRVSFGKFIPVNVYVNNEVTPKGKKKPVKTAYVKLGSDDDQDIRDITNILSSQLSRRNNHPETDLTKQQRIVFRSNNIGEYIAPRTPANPNEVTNSTVIGTTINGQRYLVCGAQDVHFVREQLKLLAINLDKRGINLRKYEESPTTAPPFAQRAVPKLKIPYENRILEYMNSKNALSNKTIEIYATKRDKYEKKRDKYSINLIDFINSDTKAPVKFSREGQ